MQLEDQLFYFSFIDKKLLFDFNGNASVSNKRQQIQWDHCQHIMLIKSKPDFTSSELIHFLLKRTNTH